MGDSDGLVGKLLLGKLEVIRLLGGGGMGEVYEVEHRLTGHRRALKVVKPRYAERPRFMKRLLREAKVAGTLGSEFVVETYDAGRLEDGSAYVLMELLRGWNLYEIIQDEGTLAPKRLASIMLQVAEGIAAAHAAAIVHRDLKPENIFLVHEDGEERVKILDFGVSKFESTEVAPTRLTAEGTLVGTPYYMSPEQAGGRDVDARSDIYALGVMMYECLVGRLPFEAGTVGELFVKIGAGQCIPLSTRRPDLDPEWDRIVHRAFHRDPEQRYPNAEALRRDLLPLARSAAAARAKTISDGVRDTIGYEELEQPLPSPAPLPSTQADAADGSGDEAPASEPPPSEPPPGEASGADPSTAAPELDREPSPAPPPPATPSRRAWLWALGGAATVALILIPLRGWLTSGPPPDEPSVSVAAEPTTRPEVPEPTPTPATPPEPPASEVAAGQPTDAGPAAQRRGRSSSPTRATAAGLDPNPYR